MSLIVLWIYQAVSWSLWKLGHARAVKLGSAVGAFGYRVLGIRRRIVEDNLRHAFPEKTDAERRAIALQTYRHLGRVGIEILISPRMSDEELERLVRFENIEPFDATLAEGKGAIACLGHLGNWELMGIAGGRRGYVFHAITKRLKGKLNERLHATRREAFKELPPKGSFQQGLDVLASGEVLALIIDQHKPGPKAVVVDFFGRPAATSPSPALFALRSGSPVWCAWMVLAPDGVYEIRMRGPFPVPDAPTLEERLQLHTQLIASDLEAVVREDPSQWFWVHRRWKYVPPEVTTPEAASRGAH